MIDNERKLIVASIKDELTGIYMEPKYFDSDEDAIRFFKYVLNQNKIMKDNAAMYSLYRLANFGEKSGYHIEEGQPYMIQGGTSVLERSESD